MYVRVCAHMCVRTCAHITDLVPLPREVCEVQGPSLTHFISTVLIITVATEGINGQKVRQMINRR